MLIDDVTTVIRDIFLVSSSWALFVTFFLAYRSFSNFTRTGPRIRDEISNHFANYAKFALLRLLFWVWFISVSLSFPGGLVFFSVSLILNNETGLIGYFLAAFVSWALVVCYQFLSQLLFIPGSLQASAQFRFSRLVPIWSVLRPFYFQLIYGVIIVGLAILLISTSYKLYGLGQYGHILLIWVITVIYFGFYKLLLYRDFINPIKVQDHDKTRMNVLMVGADTLRADRMGNSGYARKLTPFIDELIEQGVFLSNCYTSIARTAPALASLFTGLWPQKHAIRDNYPESAELDFPVGTLVDELNNKGYETAAVADWAGGDLGKINFGFKKLDVPDDQWNLKYLIRQGPAEIRLFLTLFTHNKFGKLFLPELYYLAGVPLTKDLAQTTKSLISDFAEEGKPFFLTCFMATTHVPFGSDYPYYDMFTEKSYQGESRFTMTKLASPEEIIEKQELGREAYDVEQILNLYDGSVMQFDDAVRDIVSHLNECGLADNTIVVVFSDHGADFFETGCWGQGNTLFGDDPSNRVPIVIVDPRRQGGIEVDQITRAVDFIPTLSEMLDVELEVPSDGVSLMPIFDKADKQLGLEAFQETGIWLGKVPNMYPGQLHYPNMIELLDIKNKKEGGMSIKAEYDQTIMQAKNRSVRNSRWKLIYVPTEGGVEYLLFDMETDPSCTKDRKADFPEIYTELKERLDSWIRLDPEKYYLT